MAADPAVLNRELSRPLRRVSLRWRLHPNHLTLLSFLIGLLAAGFARGTCIAHGLAVTHQLLHAPALGMAALAGIVGSFTVATYVETCLLTKPSLPEYRLASRIVGATTTRDFSVIVLLATLTGMLPWFLWGAAEGANIFWLLLLGLLGRGAATQNERLGPDPAS